MTKPARFTEREVASAIKAAISGGLEPGSFAVVLSASTGELRILPASPLPAQGGDDLDRELEAWRRNGDGQS
jgi:hypothetical protein